VRKLQVATVVLALLAGVSSPASGQTSARFSLDSVVSVDAFQGQNTVDDPNIVIDVTAVVRIADGWLVYVRPWFREPRLPRPADPDNWDKEIYQAAVQYERTGRVSTRVDAGYIVSPIGLGMMDTRPGVNPTIAPHLSYLQSMPAFDPGAPRVGAIAATYPLGAQVTASMTRWDARAAVISSAPTRTYVINNADNPAATPVVVAGGGITPMTGLRIGGAYATGLYVLGEELAVPQAEGRGFRMLSLEGEYAFRYTRISAEVTRTGFDAAAGLAIASAWFVQASHTLSPRWFVAARQEGVSAPPLRTVLTVGPRRMYHASEATLGYRLSRDVTLRGSFMSRKAYTRTAWDQQAGVSVVWARRWW
jgi:hypothetical protein